MTYLSIKTAKIIENYISDIHIFDILITLKLVKNLDEHLFSVLNAIPVKQCGDSKWCQLHGTRYFFTGLKVITCNGISYGMSKISKRGRVSIKKGQSDPSSHHDQFVLTTVNPFKFITSIYLL